MRPVKQAGVVSTHTLLFFAPVAAGLAVGASLQLLHVTREAFLFVSACMLTYSVRDLPGHRPPHVLAPPLRPGRRAVPVLDRHLLLRRPSGSSTGTPRADTVHLLYLFGTGYYQLYYLLVLLEFYALFPLLPDPGAAGRPATTASCCWPAALAQVVLVSTMHWGLVPAWMQGYWATREVTSYQFYLVAGMVVAMHLDEFHDWLCSHVLDSSSRARVAAAVAAEVWYYLAADHVVSWLGSSADPFQPIVIPFNIGAIACIYLIGVALVRSTPLDSGPGPWCSRARTTPTAIYLAQLLFITILSWLGWRHLNDVLPWPLVSVITVVIVFVACIGLDRAAGPDAAGQAPDRPDPGAVARASQPATAATEPPAAGRGSAAPDASGAPSALAEEPATASAMAAAIAR